MEIAGMKVIVNPLMGPNDIWIVYPKQAISEELRRIGAQPADMPGLWNVPGYPEITTGQLMQVLRDSTPQRSGER